MGADIRQRYADLDSNTTDVIRNIDTGAGSPALSGTIIVFGGICDSTGAEISLATSTLQTTANGLLTTIDADTGSIATSAASIDGKITACNTGAVVVSSSALPSGAATAAKQPALGTAGTASSDVITVQGIASMTALTVDGSAVTQPVSGTVTANAGTNLNTSALALESGGNLATAATLLGTIDADTSTLAAVDFATGADVASLAVTGGGVEASALRVTIASDSTGVVSVDDGGGALTVDGTGTFAVQAAQSGSWATTSSVNALDCYMHDSIPFATIGYPTMMYASAAAPSDVSGDGDGVVAWALRNGSQVVNLAVGGTLVTSSAGLPITPASGATFGLAAGTNGIGKLTANSGVTIGAVEIASAQTLATVTTVGTVTSITNWGNIVDDAAVTPTTTRVLMAGFMADESSTDSVDEGDGGMARMTLDRKMIVTDQPHTAGGLSIFRSLDLDESEEEVKATAGQIYGGWITNLATSTRYIKFYNATAANVTVGTTTPVITLPLQGGTTPVAALLNMVGGKGIAFDTAITVAATTALADNDTGAPGANEVVINLFYK